MADIKISLMNHDHVTHKLLPAAARLRGADIVSGKYKLDNSPTPPDLATKTIRKIRGLITTSTVINKEDGEEKSLTV